MPDLQSRLPTFGCILLLALSACSNGTGTVEERAEAPGPGNPSTTTFKLGGSVNGLAGAGLALQNGTARVAIQGDGPFTFPTEFSDGSNYNVTIATQPSNPAQACTVGNGSGSFAGRDVSDVTVSCASGRFTVSASVTGLSGSGLVLRNNGANDLAIDASGTYAFTETQPDGAAYNVTVAAQPLGQVCSVSQGNGAIAGANVTIAVQCATPAIQYRIAASVIGLAAGDSLVVRNNDVDELRFASDGQQIFSTSLPHGAPYNVTIVAGPQRHHCAVVNGTGHVAEADVDVRITCGSNLFSVGGTLRGLAGSGLILRLNGGNDLRLASDGTFAFRNGLPNNALYNVTVRTQPSSPTQRCTVTDGSGRIGAANVTSILVECTTSSYSVGGRVRGLHGEGLTVRLNGGAPVALTRNNERFTLATLPSGSGYNVTVASQPLDPAQTCSVTNGMGTVSASNVTNIDVNCSTASFTLGGIVSGLIGSGLELRNNDTDPIVLNGNGADQGFRFANAVASGSSYNVVVRTQPNSPRQSCTVENGQGTLSNAPVDTVRITCRTTDFSIGGVVNGLSSAGGLVLRNGTDMLSINTSGAFAFAATTPNGSSYNVTVQSAPSGQTCTVANGSGIVQDADVADVVVTCANSGRSIGGQVSGLSAGGSLTLSLNGLSPQTITANGPYAFTQTLLPGTAYAVTIAQLPVPVQSCVVQNGSGFVGDIDVANVNVVCEPPIAPTFLIHANVTGLTGANGALVLTQNGEQLAVAADGVHTFPSGIANGGTYTVSVVQSPSDRSCTLLDATGTVNSADATVTVNCGPLTFPIGGTVTGLIGLEQLFGRGVALVNNGTDVLRIRANGSFTFSQPLPAGTPYNITIDEQPTYRRCSVLGGTGIANAAVTDIRVQCD